VKRIIVTGASSYIGTSLAEWLRPYPKQYTVATVGMRDSTWLHKDFRGADTVVNVAGIAHGRENSLNSARYYQANRDLAYALAKKARDEGVSQFIHLSSMSVYGMEEGVITAVTLPVPQSHYGRSKLEGEQLITALHNTGFNVNIIRAPMVYGRGCKGNYQRLRLLALLTPVFPNIHNERSMIYIDHLCEFVRRLVDSSTGGLFFPQNKDYVCSAEMIKLIALANGRKVLMSSFLNQFVRRTHINPLTKLFGSLVYDRSLSQAVEYNLYSFPETIARTEQR